MAKKIISDEMIIDSDEGLTTDSEAERELEEKAVEFIPPRKYSKQVSLKCPEVLESLGKKKQIWLIKLPKDVDVSSIKEIPVNDDETFQINEKSYSITEDITNTGLGKNGKFKILKPTKKDGKSSLNPTNDLNIVRFLDVYESVQIPDINYDKVVVQRKDVEKETGLRMRHFPTGYYIKDFEEAKEPVVPGPASNKKRNHNEIENGELEESSKKSKKDKKDKKEKKKEKKDKKDKKDKKSKKSD